MRKYKKVIGVLLSIVTSLSLVACGSKADTNQQTKLPEPEKVVEAATQKPIGSDQMSLPPDIFAYELTTKNWNTEGITVKYPLFVNTNDQDKADRLNDLIMEDIGAVIDGIVADAPDAKGLTIDAIYYDAELNNDVISIAYEGTYASPESAYPVNFYHTLTLNKAKAERIALSDLFNIDDNFVEIFKIGYYAPYDEALNLEEAGMNIGETIGQQYTNEELITLFSDPNANYFLQEESILLSIQVPHALGDHLEMAMIYDGFSGNIKQEHDYWANYLFLSEDTPEDVSAAGFVWGLYSNVAYNYMLSYPNIYDNYVESDAGDGVTMTSSDGRYSLDIWAEYNIDQSTGASLLAEAKNRYSAISEEVAYENGYSLTFEGGGDGEPIQFVEKCYVTPQAAVYYLISYPMAEKESFEDVNARMEAELYIE